MSINKTIDSCIKLMDSGKYIDNRDVDVFRATKNLRDNKLNFVSKFTLNSSLVESDEFKKSVSFTEEQTQEVENYTFNNYMGYGYKNTLDNFEKTMSHIFETSVMLSGSDSKEKIVEDLQNNLMKCFSDTTISNDEVKKRISKEIANIEEQYNIKLSERILENASILIEKYRMSIYNIEENSTGPKYKNDLLRQQKNELAKMNHYLKEINHALPIQHRLTIQDIYSELKGRNQFLPTFVESLADKIGVAKGKTPKEAREDAITSILKLESHAIQAEKHLSKLQELNKYERLSRLATNYYLSLRMLETDHQDKKQKQLFEKRVQLEDIVPQTGILKHVVGAALNPKISSYKKIESNNEKNLQDIDKKILFSKVISLSEDDKQISTYVDRVVEKANNDNSFEFDITKEELKEAIESCRDMFVDYLNGDSKDDSIKKLIDVVNEKIEHTKKPEQAKMLDDDILSIVSNTIKDNTYNKIIEKKYPYNPDNIEQASDYYKVNIEENLLNDNYSNTDKEKIKLKEDVLSCDNMQKIFRMISDKTLTSTEALALVQNNKTLLKSFSSTERNAVEGLIEDISEIKRKEAIDRRDASPYKEYLFEDLKKKDENYEATTDVTTHIKRDFIENDLLGRNSFKKKAINFFASKSALTELAYCASKQVENRKFDTKLSMAAQCIDNYKKEVANDIKRLDDTLQKSFSSPTAIITGIGILMMLHVIAHKTRLYSENFNIAKKEAEISNIINHIDEVEQQKIKDALSIVYKLKNNPKDTTTKFTYTVDKELVMDVKKDLFYAELLALGRNKEIILDGKLVTLDEISYLENNDSLEHLKAILNTTNHGETLLLDIEKELKEKKKNILTDKQKGYFSFLNDVIGNKDKEIDFSNYGTEYELFHKEREQQIKESLDSYKQAVRDYKDIYYKTFPELKDDVNAAKNIFDINNLKNIEDKETQQELRSMLINMSKAQETMSKMRLELEQVKNAFLAIKGERESLAPYLDILNQEGKIDSIKLSEAIKKSPDKLISMLQNLDALNHSNIKDVKEKLKDVNKMIMFNIIDKSASKNGSNLLTSDFYNEVVDKVMPYSKDLVERFSDYKFESSLHPDEDKIVLSVLNKSTKDIEREKILQGDTDRARENVSIFDKGKTLISTDNILTTTNTRKSNTPSSSGNSLEIKR